MQDRSLIVRSTLGTVSVIFVTFTMLMAWSHYRGVYQFWECLETAVVGSIGAGICGYWRVRRKSAEASEDASEENVLLNKHPLLVRSVVTGLVVGCAVFTPLISLAHFRGAHEFWEIFYLSIVGGVMGSIEGYRRALRKLANEGSKPAA